MSAWRGRFVRAVRDWEATGEVWSQSGRTLFAVPLRSIDAALD